MQLVHKQSSFKSPETKWPAHDKKIKLNFLFKLSHMNSNFALTLKHP